jgi:predicted DNA-binding ribbon-helix-helix protein
MASPLIIRNLTVAGRRTSARFDSVVWEAFRDVAARRGQTVHELATEIDRTRGPHSLSNSIRVYIIQFYREMLSGRAATG